MEARTGDVVTISYHPGTLRHYQMPDAVWPPLEHYWHNGPRYAVKSAWKFWDVDETGKIVTGIDILLGKKIRESEMK